jgi:hypothetical protein
MDGGDVANLLLIVTFGIMLGSFVVGTLLAPLAIYRATVLHRKKILIIMVVLYGVAFISAIMFIIVWMYVLQYDSGN